MPNKTSQPPSYENQDQERGTKDTGDSPLDKDLTGAKGSNTTDPLKPRDVDSESHRPKLSSQTANPPSKEFVPDPPVEKRETPKEENIKPDDMLFPMLRNPIVFDPGFEESRFVPSSNLMYHVVNIMDTVIDQSHYFKRSENRWHPLISRLYFGQLFLIQILRCEITAGTASIRKRNFLRNLLDAIPLESLMLPGPLVPLFRALACCYPSSELFGRVTPHFPETIGPATAGDLMRNDGNSLLLPNIPLIIGYLNALLAIPAASQNENALENWKPVPAPDPTTGQIAGIVPINGKTLQNDPTQWSAEEAWSLTSPGVQHELETDGATNLRFFKYGKRLRIPTLLTGTRVNDFVSFMQLADPSWFSRVSSVMAVYARYFKASEPLSKCLPSGPKTALVSITYQAKVVAGQPVALTRPNQSFNLPSLLHLDSIAQTTEYEIPQLHQVMAQFSHLNAVLPDNHPYAANHSDRVGPFFTIAPTIGESKTDKTWLSIEQSIIDSFALTKPK